MKIFLDFIGRVLIEKMQGLETYSEGTKRDLNSTKGGDYRHAEEYFKAQNMDKHHKIGTLSKSEWEVACKFEN